MALGRLVDGQWTTEWTERDQAGSFKRMPTLFHQWVTADGSSGFKAESGRYHLYVSLGCPWAHRTVLLRSLKGLEDAIGLSIVDPVISDQGWQFSDGPGCIADSVNQSDYLWQVYVKANPTYTGRVTVPVLWDKQTQTIVNNESRQIIQMLNSEFNAVATHPERDFTPSSSDRTLTKPSTPSTNRSTTAFIAAALRHLKPPTTKRLPNSFKPSTIGKPCSTSSAISVATPSPSRIGVCLPPYSGLTWPTTGCLSAT